MMMLDFVAAQILESMPMTDEVEELLRVLGPFYELVNEKTKITQISDLSAGTDACQSAVTSSALSDAACGA